MSGFELFILLWVLPSLVVFLTITTLLRLSGSLLEDTSDHDRDCTVWFSVFWPVGVIASVLLSVGILEDSSVFNKVGKGFTLAGDVLVKERKWWDK